MLVRVLMLMLVRVRVQVRVLVLRLEGIVDMQRSGLGILLGYEAR